jgi:hypothetical protein
VVERRRLFVALHGLGQRLPIEPVSQDGFEVRVRARSCDERTFAGGFDSIGAVAPRETLQPSTRSKAVLGMAALGQDRADERERACADESRPRFELGDRFLGVLRATRDRERRNRGIVNAETAVVNAETAHRERRFDQFAT